MRGWVGALTATAVLIAADSSAFADTKLKQKPPLLPPPPPAFTWTGFYLGVHAGAGWGSKRFIDNFPTPDGELDADASVGGPLGGLQGGYNRQFDRMLIGIESDFTWTDIRGKFNCFPFGDQVCSAKPEWISSIAGRLGAVSGPALFYVKGGVAWTHDHFEDLATCAGSQPRSRAGITAACGDTFYSDQTRVGWLFGVGIEYFIARDWSAKVEYNYIDFGDRSVAFSDGGTGFFTEEIHQKINLIKFGVNYHFNYGASGDPSSGVLSYAPVAPVADDDIDKHVLAFAAFDTSKYSYSGTAGVMIAPYQDLDTSGLRVFLLGDGGVYKYRADNKFIKGNYQSGDALGGYGFEGNNYSVNLLVGVNAINHTLSDVDPENRVQGSKFGAKVRGDAWVNPTPQTLTYAEAEYSTAFNTYYTKAKFGFDVANGREIFVGPEIAALGDERFNQWRVGAHVTQVKFGRVQVGASVGFAHDSIVGNGAYGTVELNTSF